MEKEEIKKESNALVLISRIVSVVFTPFIVPFGAFLFLFLFSFLNIMPVQYKLVVLGFICCFTILIPVLLIYIYGRIQNISMQQLGEQKMRLMPYLLTAIPYFFCIPMMPRLNIPSYMSGILLATLIALLLFTFINLRWKISTHAGGMGIAVGTIVSLSTMLSYNPLKWLCLAILVAGMVGSARIILGKHTLSQILGGFTIGLICALLVLHPKTSYLFRFLLL